MERWLWGGTMVVWAMLCALSYAKGDLANNDFERFHNSWLSGAFAALFIAMLVLYARLFEAGVAVSRRLAWLGFAALVVPALLTFPVGSKDIFLYVIYGKLWQLYGANPHLVAPAQFAADAWYRFLADWPDAPASLYGPLFSLQMRLIYICSGGDVAVAVALQKLFGAVLVAVAAWLVSRLRSPVHIPAARGAPGGGAPPRNTPAIGASARLVGNAERSPGDTQDFREATLGSRLRRGAASGANGGAGDGWLALWLWSPLVLFDAIVTPHNDMAMTVLVLAACLLWLRERPMPALALLTLAFWYKWYALMLAPVWLASGLRRWGLRGWIWGAVAAVAGASLLVLLPFVHELGPMIARAMQGNGMREIFPEELPPPLWVLFSIFELFNWHASQTGMAIFTYLRTALLVGGLAWLVWHRRGAAFDREAFLRDCFWSLTLFFSLVPTRLWPWHLVVLCAFALAASGRAYRLTVLGLNAVGMLSYFLTFLYAVLGCGLVTAAMALLRRPRAQPLTPPG
ncbi:MAG: hypothetical protein ABI629_20405 [bacterium]